MARPKQVSDEQLRLAARKVFLEEGVNAPVALIAKKLGVTPAALFHRAKSKERLLVQALWPADPPEFEALHRGPDAEGSPRDQLVDILVGLSDYLSLAVPAIFLLHMGGVNRETKPPEDAPAMLRLRNALTRWLGQTAGRRKLRVNNAKVTADALMGTLEARHLHGYLAGKQFTRGQNRAFIRAVVDELLA